MTTQTAPVIPPRPSRSPQQQGVAPTSSMEMPKIPPRPVNLGTNRSFSPMRDSYAPSPLNELPNSSNMSRSVSNDLPHPHRPPSVTIPSLGEEGIEYADLDMGNVSDSHSQVPAETRNVSSDLKLHAPKPSLPTSSAKAQVQAVTRTDSRQIAEAGLGKSMSPVPDENGRSSRSIHSKTNGSRADSSTASSERRQSLQPGEEHGIPEIGQRVPMYRGAGDVQAPSPSPYLSEHGGQRSGRHHQRTRSGREVSLPPGSYGLHGHGVHHNDKFEKAWYEKHPDEYVKEEGQYGPGVGTPRPDWALSRDDLNKIVRSSAVTGSGLGTSPAVVGTPEEAVGYIASEEYASRLASPPPDSRRQSQPVVESPLRKMSFPASEAAAKEATIPQHERDTEKADVIHVDDPYHSLHHPDGFSQTPTPEDQFRGFAESEADSDEPILAADERRPESAYLHPAISPTFDRRGSSDHDSRSRTPSVHSRSNSRPTSIHGAMPSLARYNSREEREETHTPLQDVEEYEPLFPDDAKDKKPISAAERFKQRPDITKHRFPSEDIWEDSPNSLQFYATVTTPDIPKRESVSTFETPDQEESRKSQTSQIDAHDIASHILESKGDRQDKAASRPELAKQRFPSRDIWEDAPESQQLVTTIEPSEEEIKSPDVPPKPTIPARPQKRPDVAAKPSTSPTESRKPPVLPDRPKPQIPVRPAKPASRGSPESLTNVTSAGSTGSAEESKDAPAPPSVKPKPTVPSRPVGSKIAALKAGFLSDLNSRLQLGPQAPRSQEKKEEGNGAPAEKAPLGDARKGRARGPARRKPANENVGPKLPTIPEIRITETWNVWQLGEDGSLVVGSAAKGDDTKPVAPPEAAPQLAKNMAGESIDPQPVPSKAEISPTNTAVEAPEITSADPALTSTPATELAGSSIPTIPAAAPASSSDDQTQGAPAVEPSVSGDVPEASAQAAASGTQVDTSAQSSPDSALEDSLEDMAATADGKKKSDGDVHAEE